MATPVPTSLTTITNGVPAGAVNEKLADAGVSRVNGSPASFSFTAPAGTPFVIVVNEVGTGVAIGCDYKLSVSGVCLPCPTPTFAMGLRPAAQTMVQGASL